MSKKIMKRSLALGALMAFVITGSAWAAGADNTTKILKEVRISDFDSLDVLDSDISEKDGVVKNIKFTVPPYEPNNGGVYNGVGNFENCVFQGNSAKKGGALTLRNH